MNLDHDRHNPAPPEREISLGTATILGIFLALALLCAAFFGFGYSLGRRSSQVAASGPLESKSDSTFSTFKSKAPGPASTNSNGSEASATDDAQTGTPSGAPPNAHPTPAAGERNGKDPDGHPTRNVAFTAAPSQRPSIAQTESSAPAGPGQAIVQVSATSRPGDAESLLAALRRKGYTASIRQEPQDKLYHVQLGPFSSKKEADTMRLRLDSDGYKAIVK